MTKQESGEDKKRRLNREKQARFVIKQNELERFGIKMWITKEEHVYLKCKLREIRDE